MVKRTREAWRKEVGWSTRDGYHAMPVNVAPARHTRQQKDEIKKLIDGVSFLQFNPKKRSYVASLGLQRETSISLPAGLWIWLRVGFMGKPRPFR